jgi:hypothetical protein
LFIIIDRLGDLNAIMIEIERTVDVLPKFIVGAVGVGCLVHFGSRG